MSIYKTYRSMYDKPYYSKKGQIIKQRPNNIAPKIEKSMIIPARSYLKTKEQYFIGPNEDPETVDIPYYNLNTIYNNHYYRTFNFNYSSPVNDCVFDLSNLVTDGIKNGMLEEHLDLTDLGFKFQLCTINIESFYGEFGNIPNGNHLHVYAYNNGDEYTFGNYFSQAYPIKLIGYMNIGAGSQVFSNVVTADIGSSESTLYHPADSQAQSFITYDIDDIVLYEKLMNNVSPLGIEIIRFKMDYDTAPNLYFSIAVHIRYLKPESLRPVVNYPN